MTDHIFDNEANINSNRVTQIDADIDQPPPFFNAIAIATVVLEVGTLKRVRLIHDQFHDPDRFEINSTS